MGFVNGDPTPAQILRSCVQIPGKAMSFKAEKMTWMCFPNTQVFVTEYNPLL